MHSMAMALSASEPPDTAVEVVVGFVRDLLDEVAVRQSLRETADRLLSVARFASLVLTRAREFVSCATEQDRSRLLDLARRLGALSRALDDSQSKLKQHGIVGSMPIKGRLVLRRLYDLADQADDIAENAALGASAPFSELIHRELETVGS